MPDLVLVDDNLTTQRVFELSFAGEDISIHSFGRGGPALEHLQNHPADIAFVNVSLRDIDGYQLCGKIKSDRRTAQVAVVLLVGAFQAFDQEKADAAGCRAHLAKPFETSQLTALLREILDNPEPARPIEWLPEGLLFRIPFGRAAAEPIFGLESKAHSAGFDLRRREIAVPAPPTLAPIAPASIPPPEEAPRQEQAAAAEASRQRDFDEIVEKLAERLPEELRRLLPQVVRDIASGNE